MARYAMAIDMKACIGCNNCCMVCKVENNLPDNVWWSRAQTVGGDVENTPAGTYPNDLSMQFYTLSCQHCSNPACVAVCPTGASAVDEETGIVLVDYETCIGCKSCIEACPYTGVRTYIEGEPAYALDFAVGDQQISPHMANVVEKCTFCHHRVARGEQPACADVCRFMARTFGDVDDPNSEISKLLTTREYDQLLVEEGTEPSIYFLK